MNKVNCTGCKTNRPILKDLTTKTPRHEEVIYKQNFVPFVVNILPGALVVKSLYLYKPRVAALSYCSTCFITRCIASE